MLGKTLCIVHETHAYIIIYEVLLNSVDGFSSNVHGRTPTTLNAGGSPSKKHRHF